MTQISVCNITLSNGLEATIEGQRSLAGSNVFAITLGRKTAYVFQRALVSNQNEAKEILAAQGVVIIQSRDWTELKNAFAAIQQFRPAPLLEEPGWTKDYYALACGKVFKPKGAEAGKVMFTPRRTFAAKKGTLKGWRENIAVPLTGQVIPMIAVLGALAAPLLRMVGDNENFGFEFSGPPETGKTTSLKIMASVSGNPANVPTFNATLAAFEDRFQEFNDAPYPVDEANLADRGGPSFVKDFAFSMANGRARETRFAKDRTAYRFVFGSSSNRPFYDCLTSSNAFIADAALQRLFPLTIGGESELGVFDHLPTGFSSSGELATHLKVAMEAHYGTPLQRFLKRLVEARGHSADALKAQIQRKIAVIEDDVGIAGTARGKTRASSAFGLLYAAGCFAKMHGILPAEWDCRAACVAAYHRHRADLPTAKPWRQRVADILRDSETLDLRQSGLINLSDEDVERHGAFVRSGVKGRVELLLTDRQQRATFPDWRSLMQSVDFAMHVKRTEEHATVHRQIRSNVKRERLACIVLPADLAVSSSQ